MTPPHRNIHNKTLMQKHTVFKEKIRKIIIFFQKFSSLPLDSFLNITYTLETLRNAFGQLAQLVEPLVYTQVVGSSSLSLPTLRDVAQLVARLVWDQDVAGSNPVIPIKDLFYEQVFFYLKIKFIKEIQCFEAKCAPSKGKKAAWRQPPACISVCRSYPQFSLILERISVSGRYRTSVSGTLLINILP